MKVSVPLLAYNQEQYLRQAIDSVLMQQVEFDYELIIGEDCSTDGTADIAGDYAQRHPDKVRVLFQDRETAERLRHRGLGGKLNFITTLAACRGEYIALLDGDDYWTDPLKLQKQVDFFETHPECAICFHNVVAVDANGKPAEKLCPVDQAEISDFEQLLWGNFIPTCSVMYRREPMPTIPDWFLTAKIGDWPLNLLKAQHGKIGYINQVMAAYRLHASGVWTRRRRSHQILTSIKVLDNIDRDFHFKYSGTIRQSKTRLFFELAELYLQMGHSRIALIPVKRGLRSSRGRHKGIVSLWLRLHAPQLYGVFKRGDR
jgi:glycosyltransferase involved in cell wall biosynthesis